MERALGWGPCGPAVVSPTSPVWRVVRQTPCQCLLTVVSPGGQDGGCGQGRDRETKDTERQTDRNETELALQALLVPGSGSVTKSTRGTKRGQRAETISPRASGERPDAQQPPWVGRTAGQTQGPSPRRVLTRGAVLRGLGAAVLVGHALQGRQGGVQAAMGAGPEGAEAVAVQVRVTLRQVGCVRTWRPVPPPPTAWGPSQNPSGLAGPIRKLCPRTKQE